MMNKIIFIIISLAFSIVNQTLAKNNNWINVDYIEDMRNKLPCECMDSISSYFYVTINEKIEKGDEYSIILNRISQMEPNYFKVIDIVKNRILITGFNSQQIKDTLEIILTKDTLYLTQGNSLSKFIKSHFYDSDKDDKYLLDNLQLFNKALKERKYQSIDKILNIKLKSKLRFSCQAWWDDKNLLYVEGEPLYWFLQIDKGYLYINKILDINKDPFSNVKTKKIKRLKWAIQ